MQEIRIYTAESGVSRPMKLLGDIFSGLRKGSFLGYQLFIRDLRASVRQSFLGFFWHFIPAIAQAVIWVVLNSQKIVTVENVPMSYPAFAITGTIIWTLFVESVNKPLARYNGAKGMMVKLNFPREAILLSAVYDILFSLTLKLIVLFPALMIMGYMPEVSWLFALLGIFPMLIMGIAFGLLIVPIGMLYSDIARGIVFLFQLLMYLSPVVFPFTTKGIIGVIHKVNPISPFIEFIRSNFGGYSFNMYTELIIWSTLSFCLLLISLVILRLSLPAILERSGA